MITYSSNSHRHKHPHHSQRSQHPQHPNYEYSKYSIQYGENDINEGFPIGTLPTNNCTSQTFTDISTTMPSSTDTTMLSTSDTSTVAAYKAALAAYTSALNTYKAIPSCSPLCVGGTVDTSGNCVCATGTPYVNSDGKIYCVPVDLSSVPNTQFDLGTSSFKCKPGYSQSQLANGDATCYNDSNTSQLKGYITSLTNATSAITAAKTSIVSAYGKSGAFYIAGQAAAPTGLSQISVAQKVIGTAGCVSGAPATATVFVYNPQTQQCTYYSGTVSLASLAIGTNTVGSTTL
jgi:hypothetical protein